jgi:hypothetical protein
MGKSEQLAKKASAAEAAALREAKAKATEEAAEWEDGAKKPSAKKLEEEAKKAEKARRKAEAEEQAESEVAEMTKGGKTTGVNTRSKGKLTAAEIAANVETEKATKGKAKEDESYLGKLEENTNSLDAIDASNIDDALAALEASNNTSVDKVKLRAAFEAYQEAEMPRVKEEKPGLKLSQYQNMIWEAWRKSSQNPLRSR